MWGQVEHWKLRNSKQSEKIRKLEIKIVPMFTLIWGAKILVKSSLYKVIFKPREVRLSHQSEYSVLDVLFCLVFKAIDIPIFHFRWCLPLISNPGLISSLACFSDSTWWIPNIHPWRPLGSRKSADPRSSFFLSVWWLVEVTAKCHVSRFALYKGVNRRPIAIQWCTRILRLNYCLVHTFKVI